MRLGEKRRKQLIVPDPRNKNWTHGKTIIVKTAYAPKTRRYLTELPVFSTDDSKFGHKLMEKMGWTQGKGLGLNEQGMSDSVALRMKPNMTTKGLKFV